MSVGRNITLSVLESIIRVLGLLRSRKIRNARYWWDYNCRALKVKNSDLNLAIKNLSGGINKKHIRPNAFLTHPKIIILDNRLAAWCGAPKYENLIELMFALVKKKACRSSWWSSEIIQESLASKWQSISDAWKALKRSVFWPSGFWTQEMIMNCAIKEEYKRC